MIVNSAKNLQGDVRISGSKNAALPIMAATLLTDEEVILKNIPRLRDTSTMIALLRKLGKEVIFEQSTLQIKPSREGNHSSSRHRATYDIVKQMRASICVLGPLLAKYGQAEVSFPGGCVFGPRPIDLHLRAVEHLGAKNNLKHGNIVSFSNHPNGKLKGAEFDMTGEFGSSVLATDTAVMAATLAEGKSTILGAAREPETQDLINFLVKMGAKIVGNGSSTIRVEGVEKLGGAEYTIIQDRIEAGSFIVFSLMSGGELNLLDIDPIHFSSLLEKLTSMGVLFEISPSGISDKMPAEQEGKKTKKLGKLGSRILLDGKTNVLSTLKSVGKTQLDSERRFDLRVLRTDLKSLKGEEFLTRPYPYFPTDLQPLVVALTALVSGVSIVKESVYHSRFGYVSEINRMGSDIHVEDGRAVIHGVDTLSGAIVEASDLRAGAALVAAALAAKGESHIRRYYHIERGYENLTEKLKKIGADVEMVEDSII